MGNPTGSGSSSSSDEEDDPKWKAAIESIVATTTYGNKVFGATSNGLASNSTTTAEEDGNEHNQKNPQKLKHYQVKAQKLLDKILEKTLEMTTDQIHVPVSDPNVEEGGIRLFKNSPIGIIFDPKDKIQQPTKRPRILPRQDINEKSKKFRQHIQAIAVDGVDIIAAAKDASQKALARVEANEAKRKEKAKQDEERVAELKKIRGERWLPSMAREMQLNRNSIQKR